MKKKQKLFWLLLIPFLVVALTNINVLSSNTAKIYVDPPIVYKGKDESFKVDIKIVDVENLYSWQVNMSFNPDVLTFVNVTEGDFLKEQPEGTFAALRDDKAELGWVFFGWGTVGKYDGVSGTGTLATVEFTVKAIGESVLNITDPRTPGGTDLYELLPPPVPPGGEPVKEIPYTAENGVFINTVDPPKADFTFSPSLPSLNELITFDASASYAIDPNVIAKFLWDFGDGTTEIYVKDVNLTSTATHTYATAGNYMVTLTVIDNASATELIQAIYNTTTMPQVWYELYSTKTAVIDIKFGHNIAVTNVAPSETEVTIGETVSINVTVLNKGTETETFTVTTYYGDNEIETKQVTDLDPEEEKILVFSWDTTGVEPGQYIIWAEATVEGEGYPEDNEFIDGTVTVNPAAQSFPTTLVVGAIGAVIAVVITLFLYMRRRGSSP